MKIIQLAAVLALSLGSSSAYSLSIQDISMRFYDASGTLNPLGDNDVVAGEVNSDNTGALDSNGVGFFGVQWTATQEMYNDTTGSVQTWAGTSLAGPFSYQFTLVENQIAVGLYFNWGGTQEIAVLQIFDCPDGAPGACVGAHDEALDNGPASALHPADHPNVPGSWMVNGPFVGQHATFSGTTADIFDAKPIANDDSLGALSNTVNSLVVLANDTDFEDGSPPPAPPAVVATVGGTSSQGFSITANADGTITYTTTGGYLGADDFQYTLTDSFGNVSAAATVSITVTASPNTPPVATNPTLPTNEDTPLDIDVTTVASDADTDPLTYSFFDIVATPLGGAITVDGTNTILTYTPPANVNGSDTFTYTANDGIADSNVGTITVTVSPVNDAPVCTDTGFTTGINEVLAIGVQADLIVNCTDVDGDPLTATIASQPVQPGSMVTDDGTGTTFTYTPATDLIGDDSFTYTVSDGQGGTTTATANITVGSILSNFTMLNAVGNVIGGTNDVIYDWDQTINTSETDLNFNMTLGSKSNFEFFGFPWFAHDIRVFGPGSYSFDSGCTVAELQATGCKAGTGAAANPGPTISMTVDPGQFGVHMLFDYSTTSNIDVVNVWDVDAVWDQHGDVNPRNQLHDGQAGLAPDPATTWELVSTDDDGDGINGIPMVDGPFVDFSANFNLSPAGAAPAPDPYSGTAIDTKLGSGLLASLDIWGLFATLTMLVGLRRFSKKQ